MKQQYRVATRPLANAANIVQGDKYRFTVLTTCLIRVEYDEEGKFTDEATQTVFFRDFAPTQFTKRELPGGGFVLETAELQCTYLGGPFTADSLKIWVKNGIDNEKNVWHYGEASNRPYGGTYRTLDQVDGAVDIGHGLFSYDGWEVLDDAKSLTLAEDGWLSSRRSGLTDLYLWGYNRSFYQCLKDFYYLTGKQPMLPRYALGNWWSRYYAYTQESYCQLMERFKAEKVPFTVAVIDMDWHLTDIDPKYGIGWTGFTWNEELFPDYQGFLKTLHEEGRKTALNIHPADGIRAYEKCYPEIAKAMGIDPESGVKVEFDVSNPDFLEKYFQHVYHPMEEEGVDFWWLDWQQGNHSGMEGLDPLWVINHYHFLDAMRNGNRPMIFSRYAGPGSHRYPIGFSGDTVITWDTLNFQPQFTLSASNIGYGWWSHDIGGHFQGSKDDELYGRWIQFGVFSPICRLHSSKNEFNGREPWRYNNRVKDMAENFLRLRHRLVPYLYTMNYRAYQEDIPLCCPMYYDEPDNRECYLIQNEYTFGSEMICAPITEHTKASGLATREVWLPKGRWFDFFSGLFYEGGRRIRVVRDIDTMPVFVKAGAVIPLADMGETWHNTVENPTEMTLRLYPGEDGYFDLYEDDGETTSYEEGNRAITKFSFRPEEKRFVIEKAQGNLTLIPTKRTYHIEVMSTTKAEVLVNGEPVKSSYDEALSILRVTVENVPTKEETVVTFSEKLRPDQEFIGRRLYDFLDMAQMPFDVKQTIFTKWQEGVSPLYLVSELQTLVKEEDLRCGIIEILSAYEGN